MSNATLIEVFQSSDDLKWYYHAKAGNKEIVANSEGYDSEGNAKRAAGETFPGVTIVVIEDKRFTDK